MAVYKKVPFKRSAVRQGILCDNPQQGPSALVAAYNILAIRHSSVYGKEGPIEEDTIKDIIRGTLQTAHKKLGRLVPRSVKRQVLRAIDDLMIPARTEVRPLPSGALSFEVNDLYMLFSHLGIDLLHGWVMDPESKLYDSLKDLSPAKLAQHCALLQGIEEKDDLALVQGLLSDSARQLTAYGFASLLGKVDEGEFEVVFCHSRFNVVHKRDGELFILETDEEVRSRFPQVVWRLFEGGVQEDSIYLTEQFIPVKGQSNIAKAREWMLEKLRNIKISTETIGTSSNVGPPTHDHESGDEVSGNGGRKPQTTGQRRKCRERRKR